MQSSASAWVNGLFFRLFENTLIRRVVKNSGYLFSATGISAALSLLQGVFTARLLGVAGFGVLGAVMTFANVVNNFASFRMGELVIKYVGEYTEAGDQPRAAAVFKAAAAVEMLASLAAFGLIAVLARFGARYFVSDEGLAKWFVIYGLVVLLNLISESATGLLQIFDRFRRMAFLTVAQSLLVLLLIAIAYLGQVWLSRLPEIGGLSLSGPLLVMFSYYTEDGLLPVILAYLGGKAVWALSMTGAAFREAGRHWGKDWWRAPLSLLLPRRRELLSFGISTNISNSLSLITKDSELLFVSFFRGPVETGYYRLALGLSNMALMPVAPLPATTYPELSRETARKNWGNVRQILQKGSLLAGGYTLAAALVLSLAGVPVIRYLYGEEFLPTYPALVILLVGLLVANTFFWNRTALLSLGRPDFPTKVNLALAVAKIAGILLLVPRYGYLASAALLAGSYILGVGVSALKVRALVSAQEKTAL